jgi:hypothetical protein
VKETKRPTSWGRVQAELLGIKPLPRNSSEQDRTGNKEFIYFLVKRGIGYKIFVGKRAFHFMPFVLFDV